MYTIKLTQKSDTLPTSQKAEFKDLPEIIQIMQHLICKNGFQKCGIIYVEDGSPRIAYEKIEISN